VYRWIRAFLFLVSIGFGGLSEAQISYDEVVISEFENAFFDAGAPTDVIDPYHSYVPLWCPENIARFLERLDFNGVDLKNAKVLFLVPESALKNGGVREIHPRRPRLTPGADSSSWSFHVVLEIEGKVVDFDFTDTPQFIDAEQYFFEMWDKVPNQALSSSELLFIREIPALTYRNQYRGDWSAFTGSAGSVYRTQPVETWLGGLDLSRGAGNPAF